MTGKVWLKQWVKKWKGCVCVCNKRGVGTSLRRKELRKVAMEKVIVAQTVS